jgi:dienelactone hydrolase
LSAGRLRAIILAFMRRLAFWTLLVSLAACGVPPWTVSGGVATRRLQVQWRGLEALDVILVVPVAAQSDGGAGRTGIVLDPGGFVAPERYVPLATALAERGYAVAIPAFSLNLGFFTPDNGFAARRLLVEGDSFSRQLPLATKHVVVSGHSLGGVVAAGEAVHGGFDALLMFASEASGGDPVEKLTIPTLSISGDHDCSEKTAKALTAFRRFKATGSLFVTVQGFSHYGFTESLKDNKTAQCTGDLPLDDGHQLVADLTDLFLRSRLDQDTVAQGKLDAGLARVSFEVNP